MGMQQRGHCRALIAGGMLGQAKVVPGGHAVAGLGLGSEDGDRLGGSALLPSGVGIGGDSGQGKDEQDEGALRAAGRPHGIPSSTAMSALRSGKVAPPKRALWAG
jgi:hypothetical protein